MKSIFTCGQSMNCSNSHLHRPLQSTHFFSKRLAFTFGLFFLAAVTLGQGIGSTVVGFEVDGSFRSLTIPPYWKTTNPNQNYFGGTGADWSKKLDGTGTAVLTQSGGHSIPGITTDRTAIWQIDGNWGTNVPPDMSVFDGDNKNDYLIGAGDIRYKIKTGSSGPQKNDITNVFLHTRRDPVTDDLWLFFAAETRSVNGSSFLDFEYNQAGVTVDPLGQAGDRYLTGLGPDGGRTIDDILMVINYTQGGKVPVVGIRKWLGNAWSAELPLAAGSNYMTTNTLDVSSVAPLASYNGDGTPSNTSIAFQVVEGAVNISSLELGGLEACSPNATVTVKTRSSPSFTSTLKDWDLLNFPLTPTSSSSVADIAPQCRALNGINIFSVTGTYADGTPTWSTSTGTLSNQSYVNGVASATLTVTDPVSSATVTLTTVGPNPNCSSAVASKTAIINENPTVVANASPAGNVNIGSAPPHYSLSTTVNAVLNPAGYDYLWTQDPPQGPTTGTLSSTIIANPTFTANIAQGFTWTVKATDQVTGCFSSAPVSRIVDPVGGCPNVPRVPVCAGTTNTYTADVAPAATETWTWSVNNGAALNTTPPNPGNGGQSIVVTAGTQNFTLTLTKKFANTALADVVCNYPVTVNPPGQVNQPGNQVVCNGNSTALVTFTTANASPTTTYAWTNNTTSIGLAASGTGNIAAFTAINAGTAPVAATITVTPTFTSEGVSCAGPAKTFTITVNPTGQVNQPGNQKLCNGASTTLVTFATTNTGGTTTYAWTNDATSIGLAASGSGNIAAFTAVNTGTAPVIATIVVTPTFTNGEVSCPGPTKTFTVTVNPTGQVNQPGNQVLCNGQSTTLVTFGTANTGGTTTYAWTNNATSIGLAASGSGNIASFAAINTGTAPVVATITVTPTFGNDGVSCPGSSKTFTITVNPAGQVNQPANQVLCNGATTTLVTFGTTTTGGTTTYAWTNNTTSIGLAASGSGNIAAFTAINNTNAPVIATITVTPTFTNGGVSCVGTSKTFTITVNPTGQVDQPGNQVVCNGAGTALVTFGTTNSGGTTTYAWTNNTPSIGLASSGSGNIAAFTAVNTGGSPVVATITVTPTFTNGGVSCVGPGKTFTITVNPAGQVNQPGNQTLCNGANTALVTFGTTNTGGTTTYTWTNNTTSIGLPSSGSGNIAAFTAVNTGTSPVVATITVTPTFTNGGVSCVGPGKTFTFTVNPTPGCSIAGTESVCSGSTGNVYTSTVVPGDGTVTHSWTISGNGTITSGLTGASVTVTAGASGSYTLTDNITRNGCPSTCSKTIIIQDCGCPGPESLCTLPTSYDRNVVVNSDLNWADVLSGISPDNIRGAIRISGTGKLTVPNKDVLLKSNRAVLVIEGIEFVVKNGNFVLDNRGAQVIIKNAIVRISGNMQQKALTKLCISGTELEVGDEGSNGLFSAGNSTTSGDFQNDGGYRYLKDVCLNVTHDLQLSSTGDGTANGGGLDIFIGVYGEIGDRGATNACGGIVDGDDSGNFQNNKRQEIYCSEFEVMENIQIQSSSAMIVRDVDFRTLNGSFQNSGTLSGSGLNLAIDDLIQNSGSWTATVDMWYAPGTSGSLNIGTRAASLQAVLDAKFSCGCGEQEAPNSFVSTRQKLSGSEAISSLGLTAWPNPSNSHFILNIQSDNERDRMSLRITDQFGRLVQKFDGPLHQKLLNIGQNYRPGIYILELVQGKNRRQQKLIRLP